MRFILTITLCLLIYPGWSSSSAAEQHLVIEAIMCDAGCSVTAIRVWDGDSLRIGMTPDAEAIRIGAIDAPEMSDPACPYEAIAAIEARDRLAEMLLAGPVAIRRTGRDRYGRTLVDLEVAGVNIGQALINEGVVLPYGPRRRETAIARWCVGAR